MKTARRGGFGLLVVLMVLAALGAVIAAMPANSGAIAWQTRQLRSQADTQDLQASALAWARHNRGTAAWPGAGEAKALNVEALGIPGTGLSVEAVPDSNRVRVACRHGTEGGGVSVSAIFSAPER